MQSLKHVSLQSVTLSIHLTQGQQLDVAKVCIHVFTY